MPFPACVYINQKTLQWQHTASPTGVFEDPLDFANRSDPWLEPMTSSSISQEKKTLLFADHFFNYRTDHDKRDVVSKLREAKSEGFELLIFHPNGVIKKWDGKPIPNDYSLDSKKYDQETINHLVWAQHQLSTERFYTLDYLGMNPLYSMNRGVIYWTDFKNHPKDLIALLRKPVSHDFTIRVNADPEKFIDCILTATPPIPFDKIEGLYFDVPVDAVAINRIFNRLTRPLRYAGFNGLTCLSIFKDHAKKFQDLRGLMLSNCSGFKLSDFQDLIEYASRLWFLNLYNSDISSGLLNAILKKTSSLSRLFLEKCKNISGSFKNLPLAHLKGLYEIRLDYTDVTDDDITDLLDAAPTLKHLHIRDCKINKALKNEVIKKLELISLGAYTVNKSSEIDPENLTSLFQSSTLKELYVSSIRQFSDILQKIPISLNQLGALYIERKNVLTEEGFGKLLNAAPNLYHLELTDCFLQGGEEFRQKVEKLTMGMAYTPPTKSSSLNNDFFDTTFKRTTFNCPEYFPGIHPSQYRLSLWKPDLDSKIDGSYTTKIDDFKPIEHNKQNYRENLNYNCHKATKSVEIAEGTDIILPSLDAEEKLFDLKVFDANGKLIDLDEIKLDYSNSAQFHRITLPTSDKYTIQYQVAIPKERPKLPASIEELRVKYNKFGIADKPLEEKFFTLRKFAELIQQHKIGPCRHRCIAAYAELLSTYKEDVRIIVNKAHMMLEIKIDGRWHTINLGGYDADYQLIKQPAFREFFDEKHDEKSEKKSGEFKSLTPIAFPQTSFCINDITLDQLLSSSLPSLVIAPTDTSLEGFYKNLQTLYTSDNVFIADQPGDLNLTGFGITQEGMIKSAYTLLQQWFQKIKDKPGAIVIDIREFKDNELAQLNDILDGMIEEKQLPSQVRVLLVDTSVRDYGPDFRRRVIQKTHLAPKLEPLLEPITLAETKESKEKPTSVESPFVIDLFNSSFWRNNLLGFWQLTSASESTVHGFEWKKGKLFDALVSAKQIVFKNPPSHDKRFTRFITKLKSFRQFHWADQTTSISKDIKFHQIEGFDWKSISTVTSIQTYSRDEKNPPYFLGNSNLLSFIQDPTYHFSASTHRLICQDSHLKRCQKNKTQLNVMCVPGVTKETLAELLTHAKEKGVAINFLTPDSKKLPEQSPLRELIFSSSHEGEIKSTPVSPFPANIDVHLTDDTDFSVRKLLAENPKATAFDLSYLESSEVGRYPSGSEKIQQELLATSKLSLYAPYSSIIEKLKQGEHVILYGKKVQPQLWEALMPLLYGYIEREPFLGKLTFLSPSSEANLIAQVTGRELQPKSVTPVEKAEFLKKLYPSFQESKEHKSFATLESHHLQSLITAEQRDRATTLDLKTLNDEQLSIIFDKQRLRATEYALSINPWMMIEGVTGIGKSHFLTDILGKKSSGDEKLSPIETVYSLEEWLTKKPTPGKKLALIVDEANFSSHRNQGDNFLERFKELRNNPPGFLWKGKYYELTPDHCAIFAFNPASYGAGRSASGFLTEHALSVAFEKLPPFYIRHHIITPFLEKFFPKKYQETFPIIAQTFIHVYEWILSRSTKEILITPREIKMMLNFIGSQIKSNDFEPAKITKLASEIAYLVGKQTLVDAPYLLNDFDKSYKTSQDILKCQLPVSGTYTSEQQDAYSCVRQILEIRHFVRDAWEHKNVISTDLGLGGVVLEGLPGVGKTYFLKQILNEYTLQTGQPVYRISASTPYSEKVKLLRLAFAQGVLVVAEEMNVGLWPNKMLNNFLMGLDEADKPAKVPGFMLLTTQNPPCITGRTEDDPALRRRVFKITTDTWPIHPKAVKKADAPTVSVVSTGPALFGAKMSADASLAAMSEGVTEIIEGVRFHND